MITGWKLPHPAHTTDDSQRRFRPVALMAHIQGPVLTSSGGGPDWRNGRVDRVGSTRATKPEAVIRLTSYCHLDNIEQSDVRVNGKVGHVSLTEVITHAQERGAAVRPRVGGFPYLAESLRLAGVTRIAVTVPSWTTVLTTAEGSIVQQGTPMSPSAMEVPPFDVEMFVASLRDDQDGRITFAEWMEATWRAGVVWYEVDTNSRTCTYRAPSGECYVERYEAVDLTDSRSE